MRTSKRSTKKPAAKQLRILHLDDDKTVTSYYQRVLRDPEFGFEMQVELITTPEEFLERIEYDKQWNAVVLDVMMPHPDWTHFDHGQSDDGLLTGALLLEPLRQHLPDVPVVFLTNRPGDDFKKLVKDKTIPVLLKHDYPPMEFAEFLRDFISNSKTK